MNVQTKGRNTSLCVLIGLIGLVAVSGCAKKPTVVGKWTGTLPGPGGAALPGTAEFKEDGSANETVTAMGQTATITGTYKYENDTLTQSDSKIMAGGMSIKFPDQTLKVKLDGDTMTLTPSNQTRDFVLKRAPQ